MRIGVEMRVVTLGSAGGIAQLLRGLLDNAFARYPQHQFLCFHTIFNRNLWDQTPANVEQFTLSLDRYFSEVGELCSAKDVDVLFRGYPVEQEVQFPLERQVVHIPDIQHEQFPEFFDAEALRSRRAAFNTVLKGAGAIGTISEFARQTLLRHLEARCRDIFLISPALQVEHRQQGSLTSTEEELLPSGDYFLFPANLWKHKNHDRVLRAFERLLQVQRENVQLILTGHPDGWDRYQKEFGHLPIRHLGFVRHALLRRLMEGARALIFFSLYEGFGMPLLEAFDAGTPVLCSNTTSLPEVGGDAVLSCDPTDVDAIRKLMHRILKERDLRAEMVGRGRDRLKAYSWDQSAVNLVSALERVGRQTLQAQKLSFAGELSADCKTGPEFIPDNRRIAPDNFVREWPRVALVTPSFNQGQFLQRTIESVLTQDYPHIDYIIMDGGSTDDSLAILQSFDRRIRWVSEPDKGQAHAINKGLSQVQGEIQGYLNSDDVLLPGAVTKATSYLGSHPQCDMVFGKARFIDADDRVLGDYNTANYSFQRLMADCCISQPAAFWRTRIAEKVGPFDKGLQFALDYDYWQRIDRAGGRIEHLNEYLACTRMHAATKTASQHTAMMKETIRVCKKNAGFASLVYYQGYWHSLCGEKCLRSWILRRIPAFPSVISRLHHRWTNGASYSNKDLLRETLRTLKKRAGTVLRPAWKVAKCASQKAIPLRARELLAHGKRRKLEGFWGDNWLGQKCQVRLDESAIGNDLELSGVACAPMELTVTLRGKTLGVFRLDGQTRQTVRFHVGPGENREVELRFSKSLVDGARRKLSFLLHGTNLFAEKDLAA